MVTCSNFVYLYVCPLRFDKVLIKFLSKVYLEGNLTFYSWVEEELTKMLDQWDPAISCTIFPLTLIFSIYLVSKLFLAYPLLYTYVKLSSKWGYSLQYIVNTLVLQTRQTEVFPLIFCNWRVTSTWVENQKTGFSCSSAVICNLCR